jgi:perosamine synthetase
MDISQIEEKVTSKTKVIMIVHIYGLPVDIDPVLNLAKKYNLKVIEDAAEMHGQLYKGRPCGSFGDISIFSFYPNKHITTGEGGMILTNDDEIAETCRSLRNLCFDPKNRFVHDRLGWNLRMTNMQAAIGLAQLERLDEFVSRKRKMGALYTSLLQNETSIQIPIPRTEYSKNIYWVFGILLKSSSGLSAKAVMDKLAELGVGTRPFFCPMHKQPILLNLGVFKSEESYPVAEKLYTNGFYLPSGLALSDEQIERAADALLGLF